MEGDEDLEEMEGDYVLVPVEDAEGDEGPYYLVSADEYEGEEKTHLYDTEAERKEHARTPETEDQEGEFEEEESGGCPYCGMTLKLLTSGEWTKLTGEISKACPECERVYKVDESLVTTVSGSPLRKGDSALEKEVSTLRKEVTELKKRPKQRKYKMEKGYESHGKEEVGAEDVNIVKADKELEADVQKALTLRKLERDGKTLTPEEVNFCNETGDRSIEKKVG